MFTSKAVVLACILVPLLVCCSDLGTPPYDPSTAWSDGLTLRTLAPRYGMSDVLQLTVRNSGPSTCQVLSCNGDLSYYIEICQQGTWKDRDTINFGPEFAIYGPIWLDSGQVHSNILRLTEIPARPAGRCRLRTEYKLVREQIWKKLYSNVFDLVE